MTKASWPAPASLPGSRQSLQSATLGRQGRSTAGGGLAPMLVDRLVADPPQGDPLQAGRPRDRTM